MLSCFSPVWLFATPLTVDHQAPLSIGFCRQEILEWVVCPPPGDLPNSKEPAFLMSPALAGGFFTSNVAPPGEPPVCISNSRVAVLVAQLCLALCDPMNYGPPDSSVHEILQARTLEWIAMPSSRGSSWPRDQISFSCVSCIAGRVVTAEPPGKPVFVCILTQIALCDTPVELCTKQSYSSADLGLATLDAQLRK